MQIRGGGHTMPRPQLKVNLQSCSKIGNEQQYLPLLHLRRDCLLAILTPSLVPRPLHTGRVVGLGGLCSYLCLLCYSRILIKSTDYAFISAHYSRKFTDYAGVSHVFTCPKMTKYIHSRKFGQINKEYGEYIHVVYVWGRD